MNLLARVLVASVVLGLAMLDALDPDDDAYQILGLTKQSTQAEVRRAFRKLSLKFHPDKNPDDTETAQKNFNLVNAAYEKLGDEDAREVYDTYGDMEFHSQWDYEMAQRRGQAGLSKKDFFRSSDLIQNLDRKKFNNLTNSENTILVVDFYAPWCIHCQHLSPVWKKAAAMLEGFAIAGAVNCDKYERLCEREQIHSYPTIRLYANGRGIKGEDFGGEHDPTEIYRWVKSQFDPAYYYFPSAEDFKEKVESPKRNMPWLIMWTTTGFRCPPCIATAPSIREVAGNLEGLVNVGQIDCHKQGNLCHEKQIPHYPLLMLYPTEGEPVELESGRLHDYRFPQIGMMQLFTDITKALLSDILIEKRQKELPSKIEMVFKYSQDEDRVPEIPSLMKDFRGKERFLWESLLEEYDLTEEAFVEDVMSLHATTSSAASHSEL